MAVLNHKTVRQAEGGKQAEVEPVDLDYFIDPGKQVAEFLMDPEFVASLEESWPTVIHGLSQGATNKKAKINGMLIGRHARRVNEENTALVKMDIREGGSVTVFARAMVDNCMPYHETSNTHSMTGAMDTVLNTHCDLEKRPDYSIVTHRVGNGRPSCPYYVLQEAGKERRPSARVARAALPRDHAQGHT
jgi:hypothetical protein